MTDERKAEPRSSVYGWVAVLLALFVVIGYLKLANTWRAPSAKQMFSKSKWNANPDDRYPMISSLTNEILPSFTNINEVTEVLGDPEAIWTNGLIVHMRYPLGSQAIFPRVNLLGRTNAYPVDAWYLYIRASNQIPIRFSLEAN